MTTPAAPVQVPTPADAGTRTVDLLVGGMTCASCVGRVEKKLNRLDGVSASVDLATARVAYDPALVDEDTLVATVERTGYSASLPGLDDDPAAEDGALARALLRRLAVAAPLTIAVAVLAMAPGVPRLPWLQLLLTIPVVPYAGWPFHRAAGRIDAARVARARRDACGASGRQRRAGGGRRRAAPGHAGAGPSPGRAYRPTLPCSRDTAAWASRWSPGSACPSRRPRVTRSWAAR